jgi:hypothetical protein
MKSKHPFCAQRFIENWAVYVAMRENTVERGRPRMTVRRIRIPCAILSCITKDTNKHSEYVTLIAFPLQHWLQEGASVLRYTYW